MALKLGPENSGNVAKGCNISAETCRKRKNNFPGKTKRRRQGLNGRRNALFGKVLFPLKTMICKPQRRASVWTL